MNLYVATKNPFKFAVPALMMGLSLPLYSAAQSAEKKQDEADDKSIEHVQVISRKYEGLTNITEDTEKLVTMPGAGGDPLRAIFALPGVIPAGGSMSEPAVRGSSPKDNRFEVDFMPTGYIFHDFGNSIFSKYIVQDFRLYTAAFNPSFTNATGAVFDVSLRSPKFQPIETTVDLTMFRAGLFFEGQVTENSAFYFSARKSTLPLFFDTGEELEDDDGELTGITINDPPDDHDYQGKWYWQLGKHNSLTLSFTGAEDVFAAGISDYSDWALKSPEFVGDVIYDRKFNGQHLVWDNELKNSHLKVGVGVLHNDTRIDYGKVEDDGFFQDDVSDQYIAKARWRYKRSKAQSVVLDAGVNHINNQLSFYGFLYNCTEIDPDCELKKGEKVSVEYELNYNQYYLGANHIWDLSEDWQSEIGVHYQGNTYLDDHFVLPRMQLHYFMGQDKTISVKYGQYARMQDKAILVPGIGNPSLKSQQADHYAVSFSQSIDTDWEWSIEPYYKSMENLPLALDGSHLDSALLYSDDVSGQAYGVDLLVNKNLSNNWYGWASLSYSKSERTNDLSGEKIDYFADTPLVFNLVFNYQISDLWQGGANFTLRSGQVYTPIVGVQQNPDFEDNFQPIYSEPFSERFSPSHRLDIRFERKTNFWGLDGLLILEVVNAYGYKSPTSIDLDYKNIVSTDELLLEEQEEGLDIMPSVGFSLTF
ncbi:TonB-dependent receptor [uncultured Paraglaciecola sp.]|uniref:TonB-dependent receptor plug domain-containing protein n=1 Tax=uncultured Paraglaciecola sp. TaxID=1765024 RepID=UPI00261B8225|nr:TonB-dependent receptor [uncultured Paraglaciecola sp.]